jgi:hypothetical protein
MSTGFDFITKNDSPYVMLLYVDKDNNNCLDTDFITPNPFLGQTFTIDPNQTLTAHLFRKDGHGCNGEQGVFEARPAFVINNGTQTGQYQQFSFDSDGGIGPVGPPPNYGSQLAQPGGSGSPATWTITVFG